MTLTELGDVLNRYIVKTEVSDFPNGRHVNIKMALNSQTASWPPRPKPQ